MSKQIKYPTGESDKIPPLVLWGALFCRLSYDPPVIFTLGLLDIITVIGGSGSHPVIIDPNLPSTEEKFLNEYLQPPKRVPPAKWQDTAEIAQKINATLAEVEKSVYTELGVKPPGTEPGEAPPPGSLKAPTTAGGFSGRRTQKAGKSGSGDFTCKELPSKHKAQLSQLKGWAVMYITTSTDLSVYLVAEKASRAIYVIFRGTRSIQNAMTDANIFKIKKCPNSNKEFFAGIMHLDTEGLGTIINGLTFLADNFFPAEGREIQVFSFGHSLGGGECTLFADIWDSTYKTLEPTTQAKFKECIVCVSYGAPRIFNKAAMDAFMAKVTAVPSKILYLRVWTGGDWVPTLPPEKLKYYHPKTAQITPTLKFTPVWNTGITASPMDKTRVNYNLSTNGKFGAGTGGFSANAVAHMFQARINFWPVAKRAGWAQGSAVKGTRLLGKIVGGKMRVQVVLIGSSKGWARPTGLPTVVKREFIREEANLKAVAGFKDAKYDLETNLSENQQKRSENFKNLLSNSSTESTPDACIEGLPPPVSNESAVDAAEAGKEAHLRTPNDKQDVPANIINYVCKTGGGTKKHKKRKTKKRVKYIKKQRTKYRRPRKTK